MKALFILALALIASNVHAGCARTATGKVVCGNGDESASYNPNTGVARKSEVNANGVRTYESSTGAEAKTKNGMGVYRAPSGKTCVKGRYNQGCN
ncbi:hypothetical protein [Methylomagnum ishizawai]|uniref:hypothetical protein n=1 Tax=Methylomagnum ishizawai TaxID=1760988 RepID=UPI001C334622|nr:hypothetical protein [Methylomagnum ishizawai]BBL76374.1 hypothetical protein MishRS11D_34720 [Methylomagnum ishizawai]